MKVYKIYRLICLINGLSYIGHTHKKLIKRITEHIKAKSHIGNALRKNEVENFKVKVLWYTDNKEDACIVERAAIFVYNTQTPNGYNLTAGGEGGDTFTNNPNKEERRKKIKGNQFSKGKNLGNQFAKEANIGNQYAKGCKHSEEANEKNRQNHLGKKCPDQSEFMKGNQFAKGYKHTEKQLEKRYSNKNATGKRSKDFSENHPSKRIDVKIKKLKTRLRKLEEKI